MAGTETVAHGALSDPPECWMGNNTLLMHLGLPDSAKMALFQCNLLNKTHTAFCCEDKDCSLQCSGE